MAKVTIDSGRRIFTNLKALIFTPWKDEATFKTVYAIRQQKERLGYSAEWMTQYVYKIVTLAKKEPRPKGEIENK